MAEFDRRKYPGSKQPKLFSAGESTSKRNVTGRGTFSNSKESKENSEVKIKQPTILIKAREHGESSPKRKSNKEPEHSSNQNVTVATAKENDASAATKIMHKSLKLMEDSVIKLEALQDYLQENSDFLVIGIIGPQGVGKSTVANLLANKEYMKVLEKHGKITNDHSDNLHDQLNSLSISEDEIFETETLADVENCRSRTQGIDIYITPNRVIFLDCQPFLSISVLDELIECETKRSNLISEFIPLENSLEIQALQYTSFLMCICHVLMVVQDWFFDNNVVRFIQTAEMLKPTISNPEDEYLEHFPHLVFIQNKAEMSQFTPSEYSMMNKVYHAFFRNSKLQIQSNIGIGSGRLINSLNPENCGAPQNLFLIPDFEYNQENNEIYKGHPPLEEIINRLRALLYGSTKSSLTHVQLTEKTWIIYCSKVWETVKKSPFFVEYSKLMP